MKRLTILTVLALTFGILVAACGGDDEETAAPAEAPAEAPAPAEEPAAEADIVDTAVSAGSFTTLAAALDAAGLVETLKGDGPFTVFAPTDEAFATLPEGTLDELLMPENKDQLTAILTYHVAEGSVGSGDLSDGQAIPTLQGDELSVSIADAGVSVNDASVTTADIAASNGVIHVIDTVLLPPGA